MSGIFVSKRGSTAVQKLSVGGQVELSSGFNLTLGTRQDITLSADLDTYRWILISSGPDADTFDETQRIPTRVIREAPSGGQIFGLASYSVGSSGSRRSGYRLVSVNKSTAALTELGTFLAEGQGYASGLAYANNNLYGAFYNPKQSVRDIQLYRFTTTGGSTLVGKAGRSTEAPQPFGIGMTNIGGQIIACVVNLASSTANFQTVNTTTGAFTNIGLGLNIGIPAGDVALIEHAGTPYLLARHTGGNTIRVSSVDFSTTTPTLTLIGTISGLNTGGEQNPGLGAVSDGTNIYVITERTETTWRFSTLSLSPLRLTQVGSDVTLSGETGQHGFGLALAQTGPPYTVVSDYTYLQRSGQRQLQFSPLKSGRVHYVAGVV